MADLVLYDPKYFGTKPDIVLKGGLNTVCMMGDPNASIPTPQPVLSRQMFGANASALEQNCLVFVSNTSVDKVKDYNLKKTVVAVKNCRGIGKKDMKYNDYLPNIKVDPETYKVTIDGEQISSNPVNELPMAQSVFLF